MIAASVTRAWGSALVKIVPPAWREPLIFAVRSWLASMLALYVAFQLQLEAPYWAAMSIWFVVQPTPGMAISKSFYRIVGTLIGSVMGVVLMALFSQTPDLFVAALAVWVGVTTLASNLLRNFRSYGAVLAGYTAAVVALGAYEHPDHVLTIAFARGSATTIGIACSALVTSLLASHRTLQKTMARLRLAMERMAQRGALRAHVPQEEKLALGGPLIAELIALDAEIDFAAAESAEFRIHTDTARSLLAHLFGAIAAKRSLDARVERTDVDRESSLARLLDEAAALLTSGIAMIQEGREAVFRERMEQMRRTLGEFSPETRMADPDLAVAERVILDRLDDLLRHMIGALTDWTLLHGGWIPTDQWSLNFHRDHRAALINGARAVLAVGAAGAFWIASAWSSGTGMVMQTAVVCSLFSAAPRPDRAGTAFLIGALLALPAAFFCNFFLLENVTGFPLLALVLGLFLIPGTMFFLNPKTTPQSLAFCVVFLVITRPLNLMNYDVVSFLNNAISAIVGVAFGVMAYKLFLPPDPQAARHYVVHRIKRGLELISQWDPIPPPWAWQTRMFDRVNRLHDPANLSGSPTDEWLEKGLAALNLGNEVLRLRFLLEDGPVDARAAELSRNVLDAFAKVKARTANVAQTVHETRERLRAEPDQSLAQTRLRGIFGEMEAFFVEHPGFLAP